MSSERLEQIALDWLANEPLTFTLLEHRDSLTELLRKVCLEEANWWKVRHSISERYDRMAALAGAESEQP